MTRHRRFIKEVSSVGYLVRLVVPDSSPATVFRFHPSDFSAAANQAMELIWKAASLLLAHNANEAYGGMAMAFWSSSSLDDMAGKPFRLVVTDERFSDTVEKPIICTIELTTFDYRQMSMYAMAARLTQRCTT